MGISPTRGLMVGLAMLAFGTTTQGADSAPTLQSVLARAGRVVVQYRTELTRLVATEHSVQRYAPSGFSPPSRVQRLLVAEFGWVVTPDAPDPVGVRDVIEVDGHAVTSERARLQALLHSTGPASMVDADQLMAESARYNLGEGFRDVNVPTIAFFYLHPDNQQRFKWTLRSARTDDVWAIEFKERERPTFVRTERGSPIYSHGEVIVDPATGAIRETHLLLNPSKVACRLDTRFASVAALDLTLPITLDEEYISPNGTVNGHSTYDNYRRFETAARILP